MLSFFEMLQVILRHAKDENIKPILNPLIYRLLYALNSKDFRVVNQACSLVFMSRSLLDSISSSELVCPVINLIKKLEDISNNFWNEYINIYYNRDTKVTAMYSYKLILLQAKIKSLELDHINQINEYEQKKKDLIQWVQSIQ